MRRYICLTQGLLYSSPWFDGIYQLLEVSIIRGLNYCVFNINLFSMILQCPHPLISSSSFWSPVENRERPIKSVLSVCPSVCLSVTDYLRNAPRIFPKLGTKLKCKKRSTPAFFRFLPVFSKKHSFMRKKAIFCHFWQFLGLCGKSVPRIFLKSC